MVVAPNIARLAALIGEPARAAMLLAVSDGRALPAGELALIAGISRTAASAHLAKLETGGLLAMEREGRHRYFRLADPAVGSMIEDLARLAGAPEATPKAAAKGAAQEMRYARSCYDHLAGQLGVAFAKFLDDQNIVESAGEKRLAVTPAGRAWWAETLEIDTETVRLGVHGVACRCLDWSERRHHLAGPLGALALKRQFERDWLRRKPGSRALTLTARGKDAWRALGIATEAWL